MVTFQLTVEQFQRLLSVILADDSPDQISDVVLLACTRPHEGIISIPVSHNDAVAIAAVVENGANRGASVRDIADLMARQLTKTRTP